MHWRGRMHGHGSTGLTVSMATDGISPRIAERNSEPVWIRACSGGWWIISQRTSAAEDEQTAAA
jgi:hypothetical protein